MPMQNGLNLGHDYAVDFNLPQGPIRFSIITDSDRKRLSTDIESHGIDGVCRYANVPKGYEGTLQIDRSGPALDNAVATLDQLYYAGHPVPYGSILETINEPDGSISQWRFTMVTFNPDDLGSYKGDAKVTQSLRWKASFRTKVQ